MRDFRELKVWKKSHTLTLEVYEGAARFPKEELYGLTGQLRRSTSSIPANIAEGCGRGSNAELSRFLQIAMGSSCETEYFFLLAHDLRYLSDSKYEKLTEDVVEVKKMLTAFIQKLRSDILRADR